MTINLWAVLGAGIVIMILGFAWYSKPVFGKAWAHLLGKTLDEIAMEQKSKNMRLVYLSQLILALVASYVLAYFVRLLGATTLQAGALVGLWAGIGFVLAGNLGTYLFESRPIKLFLINSGYTLLSFVLTSALLAVWR
jgi:multidrug transporter EmrE-like cation transporter